MTTHAHPEAAILCKCREMILLLNVHLNHFPKHEKYGLCQSIRQAAYDVYALLAECQKRYHNKTSLTKLDVRTCCADSMTSDPISFLEFPPPGRLHVHQPNHQKLPSY